MPCTFLLVRSLRARAVTLLMVSNVYSMFLRSTLDTSPQARRSARSHYLPGDFSIMSKGRLLSYHRAFVLPHRHIPNPIAISCFLIHLSYLPHPICIALIFPVI